MEKLAKFLETCESSVHSSLTDENGILRKEFGDVPGESLLMSASCALSDKILLQGRVYITTKRICFYSSFNKKTLFGKPTTF